MTRPSADALLPKGVRPRCSRHYARHDSTLRNFRLSVQREFEDEIARMCRHFVQAPLQSQAGPLVAALRDYAFWLGWCAWCSTHLAPPLGLTEARDAKRMASALVIYCGPRLIDDALDDHRSYKGMHQTLLDSLLRAFPEMPAAAVRCQVGLIGSWVMFYGLQRLRRHGQEGAAERTMRLCEQIAPGAILEGLHASPLSWEQYRQIVLLKAVYYDQILYRNLIDPVDDPVKQQLLEICARISRVAQYLNDFSDRGDDFNNGRRNLFEWFSSEDEFWRICRDEAAEIVASFDALPDEVGDAFSAALIETFDSAARMEARAPGRMGQQQVS